MFGDWNRFLSLSIIFLRPSVTLSIKYKVTWCSKLFALFKAFIIETHLRLISGVDKILSGHTGLESSSSRRTDLSQILCKFIIVNEAISFSTTTKDQSVVLIILKLLMFVFILLGYNIFYFCFTCIHFHFLACISKLIFTNSTRPDQ